MNTLLINIAFGNWLLGLLSNASFIIKPNDVERKGWKKYRMGYSIKEIESYIVNCNDQNKIKKLNRKIVYRKIYPLFLISTPILLLIAN